MNDENYSVDIVIRRIPEGCIRKYTKKDMETILLTQHPELIREVLIKSYLIDDEKSAARCLADVFIQECLDIDTLESDESRKSRQKELPPVDDLWDLISEKV